MKDIYIVLLLPLIVVNKASCENAGHEIAGQKNPVLTEITLRYYEVCSFLDTNNLMHCA